MLGIKGKTTIDGKNYILQHPGLEESIQIRTDCQKYSPMPNGKAWVQIDMVPYLKYCFKECIYPDGHSHRPGFDDDEMTEEIAVQWFLVMQNFFLAPMDSKFQHPGPIIETTARVGASDGGGGGDGEGSPQEGPGPGSHVDGNNGRGSDMDGSQHSAPVRDSGSGSKTTAQQHKKIISRTRRKAVTTAE